MFTELVSMWLCVRVCVRRADGLLAPVLIPRHTLIPLPLVHSGHSKEIVGSFSTRPVQSHLCLSINKIVCNINVARVTSTATHVRWMVREEEEKRTKGHIHYLYAIQHTMANPNLITPRNSLVGFFGWYDVSSCVAQHKTYPNRRRVTSARTQTHKHMPNCL